MQVRTLRQQHRFAGAVLTLQQLSPQISAVRSDRPDPAPQVAGTPHKRCSAALSNRWRDAAQIPAAQTTRYKYSTK